MSSTCLHIYKTGPLKGKYCNKNLNTSIIYNNLVIYFL